MKRSVLAVLLLCAVPVLHAETKPAPVPDKAPKAEKPAAAAKKTPEKPAAKPAARPADKPAAAGGVDPADQALLDHANLELKKLTPAQNQNLLKLANEGTPEELQTIPGIGEIKAAAIKKARPVKSADQLIMVDGIGKETFDGMVKWVKDGMPKEAPAAAKPDSPKPAAKPAAKATDKPAAKPTQKPATKK